MALDTIQTVAEHAHQSVSAAWIIGLMAAGIAAVFTTLTYIVKKMWGTNDKLTDALAHTKEGMDAVVNKVESGNTSVIHKIELLHKDVEIISKTCESIKEDGKNG